MPVKKHKAVVPSIALYRNIAIGFLALTAILLAAVAYISVKKVTIRVTTAPQTVHTSLLARVGTKEADMPQVSGVTGRLEVEIEREFKPTGTQEKLVQATGFVTIKNETNRNQPLVATTRLLTPEGVLFRIRKGVNVPAHGEAADVLVYADEVGFTGEVGPTRFVIPGLWEPLQEKIYAVSASSMAGGVQKVGVVTPEDIEAAREQLRAAVNEEARSMLLEREGLTDSMGFAAAIDSITFEESGTDKMEVISFSVNVKAAVIAALFNQQEVIQLVNARLQEKVSREPLRLVLGNALPEVTVDAYDPQGLWVRLSLAQSAVTHVTANSPALDPLKFLGKTKEEIEGTISATQGVAAVQIRFRPAWSATAPRVPEHIQVKVGDE